MELQFDKSQRFVKFLYRPTITTMEAILNQQEMCALFIPLLQSRGSEYKKFRPIRAKAALDGERIETRTSDGLETINTAEAGDMIVQNTTRAGEAYVMSADKFAERYVPALEESTDNEGFALYHPVGRILALCIDEALLQELQLPQEFHFTASWGSSMAAKAGDYLACPPDGSSVYRIAREEFFETYQLV